MKACVQTANSKIEKFLIFKIIFILQFHNRAVLPKLEPLWRRYDNNRFQSIRKSKCKYVIVIL